MKVWLDDVRPAPNGWIAVRWPEDAIAILRTGLVTEISLDHDLGDDSRGTGYDVIKWIEEMVYFTGFVPPTVIRVHSDNGPGAARMRLGIESIERLAKG